MIHQWFMHFGGIAILLAIVGCIGARLIARRHPAQTGEDKGGQAIETIFFAVVTAIVFIVAVVLLFIGVSATYVGWVGMLLAGITLGLIEGFGD
jgi:Kef-type K+ transport system membrane component KefB